LGNQVSGLKPGGPVNLRGGYGEELGQELLRGLLGFKRASSPDEQLCLGKRLNLRMQLGVEPLGRF